MTTDPPFDLFDLTGKVAVVTGGSRGIGRSIVLGYAARGADVVIASRKLDNCEAVAPRWRRPPAVARWRSGRHVGHWDQCDGLVDTVYREFGRCDVFVNNPGMSPLYPDLASITEELLRQGRRSVNLKGPFRLAPWSAPGWRPATAGAIINVEHDRVAARERPGAGVRVRQGGAQRAHDRARRRVRAQGAGQLRSCPAPSSPTSPKRGRREARARRRGNSPAEAGRRRRRLHRHRAVARQRRRRRRSPACSSASTAACTAKPDYSSLRRIGDTPIRFLRSWRATRSLRSLVAARNLRQYASYEQGELTHVREGWRTIRVMADDEVMVRYERDGDVTDDHARPAARERVRRRVPRRVPGRVARAKTDDSRVVVMKAKGQALLRGREHAGTRSRHLRRGRPDRA